MTTNWRMKIIFSVLFSLLIVHFSFGSAPDSTAHKARHSHWTTADSSGKKWKMEHDININTTFFIKQILNFSSTSLEISPYIIGYKFFPVRNHGLRFAVGGSYSGSNTSPDSTFVQISKIYELDYRIGYEYRKSFGRHWMFFAGIDLTNSFGSNSTKVNSSTDITKTVNSTWSIGGGPVVGIQVNVSKRISLFTETAFYYNYASTRTKTSSLNFPDLNENRVTDIEQTGKFLLPTSLFFVFRF
jgi:hypothetical protein